MVLPNYEALWSLPCKMKFDIHGAFRVACGGPTADEEGPGRGNKRKTVNTVEPVFWRGRPVKFYQTLISDYKLEKGIIDLTAGDGTLMIHCAKERIPYLGLHAFGGSCQSPEAARDRDAPRVDVHGWRPLVQPRARLADEGAGGCNPEWLGQQQPTGRSEEARRTGSWCHT